jgi:lysophospholipase L1-like esterase
VRQKAKRLFANLALMGLAMLIALAGAEVVVRVFAPQATLKQHGGYVAVPGTPYFTLQPNFRQEIRDRLSAYTFATNSYGIRDIPFDSAAPHSRRVLFLGDSFTEGFGVELEDTFVKQFERRLRQATGDDWQALNLAIAGGSTFDEVFAYRTKGVPLAHQYVVLCVYVGNDITDNLQFQTRPRDGQRPARGTIMQRARGMLARHSQLWNLLAVRLHSPVFYRLGLRRGSEAFLPLVRVEESPTVREGWRLTYGAVRDLKTLVDRHGAQLLIVLIPHKVQVRRATFDSTLALYRVPARDTDIARPQKLLKQFATTEGIPVVDLLDHLDPSAEYYFATDIHFNRTGHAVTGAIVGKQFTDRLLRR